MRGIGVAKSERVGGQGMRQRGLLCIAMLAAGAIAGSFAAGTSSAVHTPELSASDVLSATEIVTLRFPSDWDDAPTASTPPAMALASADIGAVAPSVPPSLLSAAPAMSPPIAARTEPSALPEQTMAYAPAETARTMPGTPRQKIAVVTPPAPKPKAAPISRFLFNDAQIASIKNRLKLSPDQEYYWPAVEKALRGIAHDKTPDQQAGRLGRQHQSQQSAGAAVEVGGDPAGHGAARGAEARGAHAGACHGTEFGRVAVLSAFHATIEARSAGPFVYVGALSL